MTDISTKTGMGRYRLGEARVELIAATCWLVLGCLMLLGGRGLEVSTRFGPGPGFFLRWLSLALVALAVLRLAVLMRSVRRNQLADDGGTAPAAAAATPNTGSLLRFAVLGTGLLLYAVLLDDLGFTVATGGLAWVTLVTLGRPPWRALLESAVGVLLVHYAFANLLDVPLPEARIWPLVLLHG